MIDQELDSAVFFLKTFVWGPFRDVTTTETIRTGLQDPYPLGGSLVGFWAIWRGPSKTQNWPLIPPQDPIRACSGTSGHHATRLVSHIRAQPYLTPSNPHTQYCSTTYWETFCVWGLCDNFPPSQRYFTPKFQFFCSWGVGVKLIR